MSVQPAIVIPCVGVAIAAMVLAARRDRLVPFTLAQPTWSLAIAASSVGTALIMSAHARATPLLLVLGKTMLVGAHALILRAIVIATGRRFTTWGVVSAVTPILLVALLSGSLMLLAPTAAMRSGLMSLIVAGYATAVVALLIIDEDRDSWPTVIALIACFAVMVLAHLVRWYLLVVQTVEAEKLAMLATDLLIFAWFGLLLGTLAFALTISNRAQKSLAGLAMRDELTALLNRRAFGDQAQRLFARQRRSGAPLAALVIDADHFKRINDRYGHQFGDVVLQVLAKTLSEHLAPPAMVGRVGGEEFHGLIPGVTSIMAEAIADNARRAIERATATEAPVPMTVSIGLAMREDGDMSVEELFARADRALLAAKRGGRSRLVVAQGDGVLRDLSLEWQAPAANVRYIGDR